MFFEARINPCDHLCVAKPDILQDIWERLKKVRRPEVDRPTQPITILLAGLCYS